MKINFWYAGNFDTREEQHTPSLCLDGLARVGITKVNQVSQHGWREHEWMDCDISLIYGMRTKGLEIIKDNQNHDVKTIVVDLGYLNRAMKSNDYNGYWQVSLNGLNWIPDKADEVRFKSLGLDYPKEIKRKGYVLLAEQTPFDSSHGLDTHGIKAWMDNAVRLCEKYGLEYKKRHHPMNAYIDEADKPTTTIEEDLKGASCVYVHNSNVGNDAIMAGLPVVCDKDPLVKPTYYNEVSHDLREPKYPSDVKGYLNRLAYGQWTQEEIQNGKAFSYVIKM